ncbi:MAG: hypothetical protein RLZZ387_1281 [Chloroflexota bacterium]|jgi:CheY-like chemotaxis protein
MTARSLRILIADDDASLRIVIPAIVLQALPNASVEVVQDGAAALESYCQRPADVVITDYEMPVMNGLDLVRALRSMRADMPILMLSGNCEVAGQACASGATTFLEKPAPISHIKALLQRWCA